MLISTCNSDLDAALDGGFPRGLVDVSGPDRSALDMAMDVARAVISQGGIAALIDMAHDVDGPFPDMIVAQPDGAAQGLDLVQALCYTSAVDLIVVNGMYTTAGDGQIDGRAVDLLHDATCPHEGNILGTCIMFVRRTYAGFGPGEGSANGIKHRADVCIDVRDGTIRLGKPDIG